MNQSLDEIKKKILIPDIAQKAGIKFNNANFSKSIYKDERIPSLKYYAETNSYFCFSTNQGGSVVDYYKDLFNVDMATAIKELNKLIAPGNSLVPEREKYLKIEKEPKKSLYDNLLDDEKYVYDEAAGKREGNEEESEKAGKNALIKFRIESNDEIFKELWYYNIKNGLNPLALNYLTQQRKLPIEIIERFRLFTINDYIKTDNHLKKKFPDYALIRSGLYNKKFNLIFFKHRLIIPYSFKGKIVYLRGRYFDENNLYETHSCKYKGLHNDQLGVNTSKRFFNIDRIRRLILGKRLYLVEGEFDVMAMESIDYASIGIVGVGNIPENKNFRKLLNFEIWICVDQDEAGNKLKNNLINIFKLYKKKVHIHHLPYKDVNEFIMSKVTNG